MDSTSMEMTITNDQVDLHTNLEITNLGTSTEEQKFPILELKRKIAAAKENCDLLNQAAHEFKRSIAQYQNMTEESNSVLENLRSEAIQFDRNKEMFKQSKKREIIFPLKEKLRILEEEYISLEETPSEVIILREKISTLRKQKQTNDECDKSTKFKLSKQQLLKENKELEEQIFLKKQILDSKIEEIAEFEKNAKYLSDTLEQTKEILDSIRSESLSLNEQIMELNEEIALLESQLTMMKSKPLDEGTRGNCFFGEIDERRALLIKKMKQLKKAHADTMQTVARSASTLKKLRIEYLRMVEESKKTEDTAENSEKSSAEKLNIITELEEEYKALEQEYHDMPCIADPEETSSIIKYINYIINKPELEAKDKRTEVQNYSASCLEVGKSLHNKMTKLIQVRSSLLIEEAKNAKLASLVKDFKKSVSIIEDSEESIQENSTDKSCNEMKNSIIGALTSSSNTTNQENTKPEKDKKRPQLKFIDIQKKINLDDL